MGLPASASLPKVARIAPGKANSPGEAKSRRNSPRTAVIVAAPKARWKRAIRQSYRRHPACPEAWNKNTKHDLLHGKSRLNSIGRIGRIRPFQTNPSLLHRPVKLLPECDGLFGILVEQRTLFGIRCNVLSGGFLGPVEEEFDIFCVDGRFVFADLWQGRRADWDRSIPGSIWFRSNALPHGRRRE